MKKIVLIITIVFVVALSACDTIAIDINNPIDEQDIIADNKVMHSETALGLLSYISTALLDEQASKVSDINLGLTQLVKEEKEDSTEEIAGIEKELEQVNIYMDKLKSIVEFGVSEFGEIQESTSDRPEYEFLITIRVDGNEYFLYYNIDFETSEISGVFILDETEYIIEVENGLEDSEVYKDSNEEQTEDLSEDENYSMKLLARNGVDIIIIEYEVKQEDDESKQTFSIISNISGIIEEIQIQVKIEDEEYKLEILDNGNEYTFKVDSEEEGDSSYKLEYVVDGVKGFVKIIVSTNDDGETVYTYLIKEKNIQKEVIIVDSETDDSDVGN